MEQEITQLWQRLILLENETKKPTDFVKSSEFIVLSKRVADLEAAREVQKKLNAKYENARLVDTQSKPPARKSVRDLFRF